MFANEKNKQKNTTNVCAVNVLITTIKRTLNKIGLHRRGNHKNNKDYINILKKTLKKHAKTFTDHFGRRSRIQNPFCEKVKVLD